MNDTQLRQLAEQHGFFGVDVWWAQNLPRFRGLLETSQARLTLTEAALSAAGELLNRTYPEKISDNEWYCEICGGVNTHNNCAYENLKTALAELRRENK